MGGVEERSNKQTDKQANKYYSNHLMIHEFKAKMMYYPNIPQMNKYLQFLDVSRKRKNMKIFSQLKFDFQTAENGYLNYFIAK